MPHPDMNEMWNDGHPDEGLLHEWLDEQLSAADAAVLQSHVQSCGECQARVAEARGLMAASHRILSALDDVPANVVPKTFPSNVEATADLHSAAERAKPPAAIDGVTSIDAARKRALTKGKFRWQAIGAVAAVLLAAVTIERAGLFSPGATAPVVMANEKAGASPVSDAASSVVNAPARSALAATAPIASPPATIAAAEPEASKVAARKAPAPDQPTIASAKTAVENARAVPAGAPAQPAAELRADDARALRERVADAGVRDSRAASGAGAASGVPTTVASANASRSTTTADRSEIANRRSGEVDSLTALPPPAAPELLQGKIAGMRVLSAATPREGVAQRSATSGFAAKAAPQSPTSNVLPFDSLMLVRTACTPNCEPVSTLGMDRAGTWRLIQPKAEATNAGASPSQLSAASQLELSNALGRALREAPSGSGQINCDVPATREMPGVRLTIKLGTRAPERAAGGCTLSAEAIRSLAARIESLTGVNSLRRD